MRRALVAVFAMAVPLGAAIQQAIELRCPPATIARIEVTSGSTFLAPNYVGDINGDGCQDFFIREASDGILVYGGAHWKLGGRCNVEVVPSTRFVTTDNFKTYAGCYAGAGDVDGDGFGDMLIGSWRTEWGGLQNAGLVLLIFGGPALPREVNTASLEDAGIRFRRFISRREGGLAGRLVCEAGDLNRDGLADFAIAVTEGFQGGYRSAVKIILGGFDSSDDIELEDVGSTVPGLTVHEAHEFDEFAGPDQAMDGVGDVDGDGCDDLAIGAYMTDGGAGSVYLVLGDPDLGVVSDLYCSNPAGPLIAIKGTGGLGFAVAGTGDVDGDEFADVVASAPWEPCVYVIFGKPDWSQTEHLQDLRAFKLCGQGEGWALAGVGDWNGDGYDDFLTSQNEQLIRYATDVGEAHLVFGGPRLAGERDVALVGTPDLPGLTIRGGKAFTNLCASAEGGKDLDGDGRPDTLLAAPDDAGRRLAEGVPRERSSIYLLRGGMDFARLDVFGVLPSEGFIHGGYEATLIGAGFGGDDVVEFGGTPAQVTAVLSSAEMRVVVPPREKLETVDVEVHGTNEVARLHGGFAYGTTYQDLVLSADWLRGCGYRVLEFTDLEVADINPRVGRMCACAFMADVDGDWIDDLVVGDPGGGSDQVGRVSIVFGRPSLPERIGPGETGLYGTVIVGPYGMGPSVVVPGDLNRDGYRDLALGWSIGTTSILFGRAEWPPELRVSDEIRNGGACAFVTGRQGRPVVAAPGDMDGDGIPDLAIGCWLNDDPSASEDLHVSIFAGGMGPEVVDPSPTGVLEGDPAPVAHLTGGGIARPRQFGAEVEAAGDLNGDTRPDLIVGADHTLGAFYFIMGGEMAGTCRIRDLLGSGRAVSLPYEQEPTDFGLYAAGVGDFNGDGLDDAVLGCPMGGRDVEGRAHVVFGSPEFGSTISELKVLREDPGRQITIEGEWSYDWAGYVEPVGDVNGDGLSDVGITSFGHLEEIDQAYVVFGTKDPIDRIHLSNLGRRGFRISTVPGNKLSASRGGIAGGDLDGDGLADIAIGEYAPDGTRRVMVIFGRPPQRPASVYTGDANADGRINIADAIRLLGYLFGKDFAPSCMKAADANDDDGANIADAISILSYLFASTSLVLPDGRTVRSPEHPGCVEFSAGEIPATIGDEPGCTTSCVR